eukprot:m.202335 g.202335  ORF g.202335 m.202335 type:complete len:85 (+) comp39610_c0_seq5:1671-1925(+)
MSYTVLGRLILWNLILCVLGGEGETDVPVGYIVGIAVLGVLLLAVSIILVVFSCCQRKTADDVNLQLKLKINDVPCTDGGSSLL